ncbi:MAG: hypothetical protein WCS42_25015 [Verrucomicrobiota bacterium]
MATLLKINRRDWLALWAQQRRRRRHALPAPVLRAQYPTQIVWTWDYPNPYRWLVYTSLDSGATWFFTSDYWKWGADRLFAPDGGSELYYIVGVDAAGVEVTERSNAVRPDDAPVPSSLLDGLEQFYVPQPGSWFLKSFNEAIPAGLTNPFVGMAAPCAVTGAGSYVAGNDLYFQLLPYREDGNGRVYAGTILRSLVPGATDAFGVVWPEWSAVPGWVTGYTVLVYSESTDYLHRDVSAASMFAGWTDDGTGWTEGVFPDFENAPRTLKLLWCQPDDGWNGEPVPVNLTASPLGGYAFDATFSTSLTRALCDDLRRSVTGTLAFWVNCDMGGYEPVVAAVRGVFATNFQVAVSEDSFKGNNSFYCALDDCQMGDWYLVVLRNDEIYDTTRLDIARLRDGTWYSSQNALSSAYETSALTGDSNYLEEAIWGVLTFGGAWHWGSYYPSLFDRMGIWNRPLTDFEVQQLFNQGLGWQPD